MNWKAQKNEELWKYSYDAYKKTGFFFYCRIFEF